LRSRDLAKVVSLVVSLVENAGHVLDYVDHAGQVPPFDGIFTKLQGYEAPGMWHYLAQVHEAKQVSTECAFGTGLGIENAIPTPKSKL
jgi:hypothetical protein